MKRVKAKLKWIPSFDDDNDLKLTLISGIDSNLGASFVGAIIGLSSTYVHVLYTGPLGDRTLYFDRNEGMLLCNHGALGKNWIMPKSDIDKLNNNKVVEEKEETGCLKESPKIKKLYGGTVDNGVDPLFLYDVVGAPDKAFIRIYSKNSKERDVPVLVEYNELLKLLYLIAEKRNKK